MENTANDILERLAVSGLVKCLAKLAKVSAGTWRIRSVKLSRGTLEDAVLQHDFSHPAAAVYFHARGEFPFTSMILFDLEHMELISKCFLGYSFPKAPTFTQTEEVLLMELGNIVVNSLINSVMNALQRSCIPPVPRCVDGDARRVATGAGSGLDPERNYLIITAALAMQCDKKESITEVIGLIPEELERELERLNKEEPGLK